MQQVGVLVLPLPTTMHKPVQQSPGVLHGVVTLEQHAPPAHLCDPLGHVVEQGEPQKPLPPQAPEQQSAFAAQAATPLGTQHQPASQLSPPEQASLQEKPQPSVAPAQSPVQPFELQQVSEALQTCPPGQPVQRLPPSPQ